MQPCINKFLHYGFIYNSPSQHQTKYSYISNVIIISTLMLVCWGEITYVMLLQLTPALSGEKFHGGQKYAKYAHNVIMEITILEMACAIFMEQNP